MKAPLDTSLAEPLFLKLDRYEEQRQRFLLHFGNAIAAVLLISFGLLALRDDYQVVAGVTLLHATLCSLHLWLLQNGSKLQFINRSFMASLLLLFAFLLTSGGIGHTGPMWAYPLAAATIFLQGARRGLWLVALMLAFTLLVFYGPYAVFAFAAYSADFKVRFLATFSALAMFAWLHEFGRARGQTQLLRVSAQLDRLSHSDPLTGLPNRRYMLNRLEAEHARYQRHQRAYSIVFADIDFFKSINDCHGHQAGDDALCAVAQALRTHLRQTDEVCRWGGEEFLLLLPETDLARAAEVAEKLRLAIAAIALPATPAAHATPRAVHLSMSFGVHTAELHADIDHLIGCADRKLYLAKQMGRNRVVAQLNPSLPANESEVHSSVILSTA